jgi:hypothetical protein
MTNETVVRLPARHDVLRRRATKIASGTEGQQNHLRLERAVTLAIARLHFALAKKFPAKAYARMADRETCEGQALSDALVSVAAARRPA